MRNFCNMIIHKRKRFTRRMNLFATFHVTLRTSGYFCVEEPRDCQMYDRPSPFGVSAMDTTAFALQHQHDVPKTIQAPKSRLEDQTEKRNILPPCTTNATRQRNDPDLARSSF